MGREIRRVPPNWQHPTHMVLRFVPRVGYRLVLDYVPMEKASYAEDLAKWERESAAWDAGERPSWWDDDDRARYGGCTFSEYDRPRPEPESTHRTYDTASATWFQLYETVSEGSPVSPPFATLDELAAYLGEHGDYWDQDRAIEAAGPRLDPSNLPKAGWGRERADAFCKVGWAPSMVVRDGAVFTNPGDMVAPPLSLAGEA